MTEFVNVAIANPVIARVPFMLESSSWEVIEAGLKCIPGKALVHCLSLQNGEAEFLRKSRIVRKFGAAPIVKLSETRGAPVDFERTIEFAARCYTLLTEDGFPPEDIVFDPGTSVGSGFRPFCQACSWIREHCPFAQTIADVSGLSLGFQGNDSLREAIAAVFVRHALKCGVRMAIFPPGTVRSYENIDAELRERAERVLFLVEPKGQGS
jgi:5-methyltetrahydrofolate--homocysteine methyltransferase